MRCIPSSDAHEVQTTRLAIRSLQFDQKVRPLSFRTEKFDLFTATQAIMSLHNFCLRPNTCHLAIRSKIWVLLYQAFWETGIRTNEIGLIIKTEIGLFLF